MVNKNITINLSDYRFCPARSCIFLLLGICLFSFNGCSSEKKITEPEVLDVLNKIEVAAKNKDADAIVANMSEKVQIKATITASGQTQTFTFNREQYRDFIKKSFAAGSNYTYSRQNTQVKISPDGKMAIVTDEVTESMTVSGQVIRSVGTEVATLGRENGKLVIQYLEANGKQD